MLLALAVLVIGGAVLSTGPVKAVIVNFNVTGNRTTVDSLLCPGTTYTFFCEISGDVLQLVSIDSDGSDVNTFNVFSTNADEGTTSNLSELNFTAFYSVNGLIAASAVMKASTDLSSVQLVCRDVNDGNSSSISTVVKDPLDRPNLRDVACFSYDNVVTYIKLTWEPVECAEYYQLTDFNIDPNITRTNETSYENYYDVPATYFSVSIFAIGGSLREFNESCLVVFNQNPTTPPVSTGRPPNQQPESCVDAINTASRCGIGAGNIDAGYIITFSELPDGGNAYYETSDGRNESITISDSAAEVLIDSNVTVYVVYENGTVYYSQKLQVPSVSGEEILIVFWILVVIVALAIILGVGGTITGTFVVKQKTSNQVKQHDTTVFESQQHQEDKL